MSTIKIHEKKHAKPSRRIQACTLGLPSTQERPRLLAIGASTGGPGAILRLLKMLPSTFTAPIILAQHIEQSFIENFVAWLNSELSRPVLLAKSGDELREGHVYVSSASGNLSLTPDFVVQYGAIPPEQIHAPSIDSMFHSFGALTVDASAVLLTGMGNDGAQGLKFLAERGWSTYTQSAESCAVYGMPKAAMALSPRHQVGDPESIAQNLRAIHFAKPRRCHE